MTSRLGPLLEVILEHLLTDGDRPPQIVPLPDDADDYAEISIILPVKTDRVLSSIAETYGTSKENIARILINATSTYVAAAVEDGYTDDV